MPSSGSRSRMRVGGTGRRRSRPCARSSRSIPIRRWRSARRASASVSSARRAEPVERVAMFGGTFDPPHVGHLALAEWARERLSLDKVLFVPAGRPPHKSGPRLSNGEHRLAMTRLAVRGNPAFEVSAIELERDGPSYTEETLQRAGDTREGGWCCRPVSADHRDEATLIDSA